MKSIRTINGWRWGVVIFYVLLIVVNYLSQTLPFNGQTNGEVSNQYSTLMTPAGYAFSIWGLIYLALGVYAYFQAFRADNNQPVYDKIAPLLIINFIFNGLWLVVFQYEYIALSVIVMAVILATLIRIEMLLVKDILLPPKERNGVRIPFGLYLGWISVATIVNISVWLKYSGWQLPDFSETAWVVIMTVIGAGLAYWVLKSAREVFYPLVFVWAYVAIAVKQYENSTILQVTSGLAMMLLVLTIIEAWRNYRKTTASEPMKINY